MKKFVQNSVCGSVLFMAACFGPHGVAASEVALNLGQESFAAVEDEVLDLIEERDEQGWASHKRQDDSRRARRIQKLKTKVIEILAETDAQTFLERIEENRRAQIDGERRLADLRVSLAGAPEEIDVDGFDLVGIFQKLFVKTKDDYRDKIQSQEGKIEKLAEDREVLKDDLLIKINSIGIGLDRDDLDGLLNTVTATGIIDMHAVYMAMQSIHVQLEESLGDSKESIDVARRYYGIYTVLLETAYYMHVSFLGDIEIHDQKLVDIIEEAKSLRGQSNGLIAKNQKAPELVKVLKANRESQWLTIRAGRAYRIYLRDQEKQIQSAQARLGRQIEVAVNTYRTVTVSSALLDIMRSQTRDFEVLLKLQVPDLKPFMNKDLEGEFSRLNARLKQKG